MRKLLHLGRLVILKGKLEAIGVTGVRKLGDPTPVQVMDKYHIGSCGKAMTATLVAILIEQGYLNWDTRVANVFTEIKIDESYKTLTLQHLLHHVGGLPGDVYDELWGQFWDTNDTVHPTKQRETLVADILSKPAEALPNQTFVYSNVGYAIVGAMLEKLTGKTFESLMVDDVFIPLNMSSSGFGAPAKSGIVDQPYGHDPEPVDPQPYGDNPRVYSPAGTVHCSLEDWAKFAMFHLTGKPEGFLSIASKERLHQPSERSNYACGWRIDQSAKEKDGASAIEYCRLSHDGSNTTFMAGIFLFPEQQSGILIATNNGTEVAGKVCKATYLKLKEQYIR